MPVWIKYFLNSKIMVLDDLDGQQSICVADASVLELRLCSVDLNPFHDKVWRS